VLYAEGETAPKMLSIGLHCRIIGRPARMAALQRFIEYVQSHDQVWCCTREQIALHWKKNLSESSTKQRATIFKRRTKS
jgi:allantoinase